MINKCAGRIFLAVDKKSVCLEGGHNTTTACNYLLMVPWIRN